MDWKKTKLYSIFNFKCPQCHKGEFLKYHPYNLPHVGEIHHTCSHCGCKFEKEIGFYYGAMYVSYALGVAVSVSLFVATYILYPSPTVWTYIWVIVSALVVLSPYLYALSKIIWANMFIKYEGD